MWLVSKGNEDARLSCLAVCLQLPCGAETFSSLSFPSKKRKHDAFPTMNSLSIFTDVSGSRLNFLFVFVFFSAWFRSETLYIEDDEDDDVLKYGRSVCFACVVFAGESLTR